VASSDAAVVTGPSRGIGRETALLLAERGCTCFLLGRPSVKLDEVLAECRNRAPVAAHVAIPCDLEDFASIDAAAHEVLLRATPRVLVNNAGIIERALLEAVSIDSLRRQLDTNLVGPIWLTRALLPAMRAAAKGSIVNVASISAELGTARQVAYNASKWGLVGFTKSLAEELSNSGVFTVAVLPGAVDTEMTRGGSFPPRMSAREVAQTLVHYALDASPAHNGGCIEMFGV
jgi:3-oxoacyl-[acyl-carrier protein] reductase